MRSFAATALGAWLVLASVPGAFANCAADDPNGSKTLAARQQVATELHVRPQQPGHGEPRASTSSAPAGVAKNPLQPCLHRPQLLANDVQGCGQEVDCPRFRWTVDGFSWSLDRGPDCVRS